jgi:exodeoxyribonuclease V gamma subunit
VAFDLMRGDRRPGDRSRESDDRYLLLEALLAAREQLYVSWLGHDARDGAPRNPSVLVGQLRDHVAAGWRLAGAEDDEDALLKAITTEHPLQPFSRRYFSDSKRQGIDGLYSYAREWRAAHDDVPDVSLAPKPADHQSAPTLPAARDALPPEGAHAAPLTLARLTAFFRQPAQAYFRERLAVRFAREDEDAADDEPFALQGLDLWALDTDLRAALQPWCAAAPSIDAARAGLPAVIDAHILRLQREGRLPLAAFGDLAAQDLRERAARRFGHYLDALATWPHEETRRHTLHWRDEASGTVIQDVLQPRRLFDDVAVDHAAACVALADGRLHDGKGWHLHRIAPYWPAHLGLQIAAGPTLTVLVSESGTVTLPALSLADAQAHLSGLLSAYAANLRTPLPVVMRTAFAFLTRDERAARQAYEGDGYRASERDRAPAAARLWPDFNALLAAQAEGHGLLHWCQALYRPIVDAVHPTQEPE